MGTQLANLYLRGKLMSVTGRELPPDDLSKVEHLMLQAWKCQLLHGPKMEFCMALSRTIGNEYKDYDIGMQDAQITFWRAALMVLFHESKRCAKCNTSFTTTYSKLNKCNKHLTYWCSESTRKIHGKVKPVSINKSWLAINTGWELVDENQRDIVNELVEGNIIRASACPQCLKNNKLQFIFKASKCGGELESRWLPNQNIAIEAMFECKCGKVWTNIHDGESIDEKCVCGKNVHGQYLKRKKFFQTYLFNYLKQILRENKPPLTKTEKRVTSPADEVMVECVRDLFDTHSTAYSYETIGGIKTFKVELGLVQQKTILMLASIRNEFNDTGAEMQIGDNMISIVRTNQNQTIKMITRSMISKTFMKFVSLSGPEEESSNDFQDFCEFKANSDIEITDEQTIDENDRIANVRKQLPTLAQEVLDLIVNTPEEYYTTFKTDKFHKNHICKFLNKTQNEVDQAWTTLRLQMMAAGIRPD